MLLLEVLVFHLGIALNLLNAEALIGVLLLGGRRRVLNAGVLYFTTLNGLPVGAGLLMPDCWLLGRWILVWEHPLPVMHGVTGGRPGQDGRRRCP